MMDRPVETWTWDDLLTWSCWEIVKGITSGISLRVIMDRVLRIATQWKPPK